jgi:2-hydroxychromene-2-carboxylate isomerase
MSHPYDIEFFWDPVCPVAWKACTTGLEEGVRKRTGYPATRLAPIRLGGIFKQANKSHAIAKAPQAKRNNTR